jgi:hypothetical protein
MNAQTTYLYSDGSANTFILTPTTLEYDPVTPEKSSTGTYSGGIPGKVDLKPEEYRDLVRLFESAFEDTGSHQQNREKMTGLVTRKGTDSLRVVLKRDAGVKVVLEKKLKELMNQK